MGREPTKPLRHDTRHAEDICDPESLLQSLIGLEIHPPYIRLEPEIVGVLDEIDIA
jgi:hypothetical protein